MQLLFKVNLAECFRRGENMQEEVQSVEVDPVELTEEDRSLIADRMHENHVCYGTVADGRVKPAISYTQDSGEFEPCIIEADAATIESVVEAVRQDQAELQEKLQLNN